MAKKILVDINLNQNEIQNAVVQNLASDPTSPLKGQMYFNTTTNRYRVYNGTSWDEMGTGGGTVTSVSASSDDDSLTVTGSPITSTGTIEISHKNKIEAQETLGLYPIAYDANGHITSVGEAQTIPTKTSELTNDSGFLTEHQDISGKEDTTNKVTTISSASTDTEYPSAKAVYTELNKKVDKVTGKGLSTNDYTTAEKTKLDGIATGAEVNVIDSIKVNGTEQTITDKAIDITVPTKVSDLTNDSAYITEDVDNLTNYTKTADLATVATSGAYSDLTGTPTKLTDFTNDLSYGTAYNATTNKIATQSDVNTAIAGIAGGMYYKGTIGEGGTAGTTLPTTGVKVGDTYRICSDGTYNGEKCTIGDLFIATSTKPEWSYIPSGNDQAVTSVTAGTGLTGGTITSTGTIALSTSGVTAGTYQGLTVDTYGRVTKATDMGYTTNKGTVTSVGIIAGTGVSVSGSPITESGSITVGLKDTLSAAKTQAVYPIAIDKQGRITAVGDAQTILGKYSETITGDGSTKTFTISHGLSTSDVIAQVYDGTSQVIVDIEVSTSDAIIVSFAKAPSTSESYKVVVIG